MFAHTAYGRYRHGNLLQILTVFTFWITIGLLTGACQINHALHAGEPTFTIPSGKEGVILENLDIKSILSRTQKGVALEDPEKSVLSPTQTGTSHTSLLSSPRRRHRRIKVVIGSTNSRGSGLDSPTIISPLPRTPTSKGPNTKKNHSPDLMYAPSAEVLAALKAAYAKEDSTLSKKDYESLKRIINVLTPLQSSICGCMGESNYIGIADIAVLINQESTIRLLRNHPRFGQWIAKHFLYAVKTRLDDKAIFSAIKPVISGPMLGECIRILPSEMNLFVNLLGRIACNAVHSSEYVQDASVPASFVEVLQSLLLKDDDILAVAVEEIAKKLESSIDITTSLRGLYLRQKARQSIGVMPLTVAELEERLKESITGCVGSRARIERLRQKDIALSKAMEDIEALIRRQSAAEEATKKLIQAENAHDQSTTDL